ncbi:MAG: hypothetical protein ACR2H9_13010 [Longimicrobiaceae bacterium]
MATLRLLLTSSMVLALGLGACKTPRQPIEVPEGNVSGVWSAETGPAGEMRWQLSLEQGAAGKLTGEGSLVDQTRSTSFSVNGIRGENTINFDLDTEDAKAKFDGSIMDMETIVGELYLETDTLHVTFTRPSP